MLRKIGSFFESESGAVTVDWVVLTAAVVGLAIGAWATIYDSSVTGVASATGDALDTYHDEVFQ
jgi:hypothetical protein